MPTVRFQLRRDTAANWIAANPTLGPGEPALETDTLKVKYGNGVTAWNDLPYAAIDLPAVLEAYADGPEPDPFSLALLAGANAGDWRAELELGEAATQDYEEGEWTPTVAPASGVLTSYTATGDYTKIGRQVHATVKISIGDNGDAAGALLISLPYSAASGHFWAGSGRENGVTGSMLQALIYSGGPDMIVWTYNNGYPGATGALIIATISYFV